MEKIENRSEKKKKPEGKEIIGKRLRNWEVPVAVAVALTLAIGKLADFLLQSILISFLEVVLATAIWAVKTLSEEVHEFRTTLSEQVAGFRNELAGLNELLGHVGKLRDPTIPQSLTKITFNLTRLMEHPLLLSIMKRELETTADRFSEAGAGETLTTWARVRTEATQEVFDHYMRVLDPGSEYDTVSNLDFWSRRTLARPLDLLDANIAAAKRGVVIIRVFLLTHDCEELTDEEMMILGAHEMASRNSNNQIRSYVRILTDPNNPPEDYGNYGLCRTSDGSELLLEMYYTGKFGDRNREFERMEIVRGSYQIEVRKGRFKRLLDQGIEISEFLAKKQEPEKRAQGNDTQTL